MQRLAIVQAASGVRACREGRTGGARRGTGLSYVLQCGCYAIGCFDKIGPIALGQRDDSAIII